MENDDCNSTYTEIYERNTDTFSWDIQKKLHPYRNYTVVVTAFTIAKGEVFTNSISTLEYSMLFRKFPSCFIVVLIFFEMHLFKMQGRLCFFVWDLRRF